MSNAINLHDAVNTLLRQKDRSGCGPDLVRNHYPELHQIHLRDQGKTYLVVLGADCRSTDENGDDYWDDSDWIMSDVCVLDYQTGSMTVLPKGTVTPQEIRDWMRDEQGDETPDEESSDDGDPGDMDGDAGSALASAGWGTDEDYGGCSDWDD